jgi:hypothetical protein
MFVYKLPVRRAYPTLRDALGQSQQVERVPPTSGIRPTAHIRLRCTIGPVGQGTGQAANNSSTPDVVR